MDYRPPSPTRRATCVEDVPRLDLWRLVLQVRERGQSRVAGTVPVRWGLVVSYRIDLEARTLATRMQGCQWHAHQVILRATGRWMVPCPSCSRRLEILYWPMNQGAAGDGAGSCGRCAGLRHLRGQLKGGWKGADARRLQVRMGDVAGLAAAAQADPLAAYRVRQAMEEEGLLPRRFTLTCGRRRRWAWRTIPQAQARARLEGERLRAAIRAQEIEDEG